MEESLEKLIQKVGRYDPQANMDLIRQAYQLSDELHCKQTLHSGDFLIKHLTRVAELVAEIHLDTSSVITALLHESVRKGGYTLVKLREKFGPEVAYYVETLTQLSETQFVPNDPKTQENIKKVFFLLAKDPHIALIRLADRVDNIETISALSPDEQAWAGRQALNFYAPIAEILGVHYFKRQLEDAGFAVLHPDTYKLISNQLKIDRGEMEESVEKIRRRLLKDLALENIYVDRIFGRVKHVYSIWKKLLRYQKQGKIKDLVLKRIYDQMALMIIAKNEKDCYETLGIINKLFNSIPEEFDDYIAKPKPNGYRALHLIIKDESNKIFEIQIRTEEMHAENEFGQAAHLSYKQQGERNAKPASTEEMDWAKRLTDWSGANVEEIFGDKVFVFSPKRDVFELPEGSTPVDFAYAVHTGLGDKMVGAKVDGKMVHLKTPLKSGQTVEIVIDKNKKKPSKDWLDFAVTRLARREINKYFNQKEN